MLGAVKCRVHPIRDIGHDSGSDLPGLPASELCGLTFAKARRFTKGFDRKLKSWVVVYQSTTYPIPCKNR